MIKTDTHVYIIFFQKLLYFWFRDLNEEIPIYPGSRFQAGKVII